MRLLVDHGSRQVDHTNMQAMHGSSEPGIFYMAVNDFLFVSFFLMSPFFIPGSSLVSEGNFCFKEFPFPPLH